MSSWRSHLPARAHAGEVIGLGMNAEEMGDNPQLAKSVVHDLNRDPRLPFGDAEFDGAMCAVSIQYMTHPVLVFRELKRVLRPGAPFVVSFSNRCFPTKAVSVWLGTSDSPASDARALVLRGGRGLARRHGRGPVAGRQRRSALRRVGEDRMKTLTSAAVERYHRDGFYFPIPVLTPGEAARIPPAGSRPSRLRTVERSPPRSARSRTCCSRGWPTSSAIRPSWTPSRTCWARTFWCGAASFFIKDPRDSAFVSWHQDATYWGLSEPDVHHRVGGLHRGHGGERRHADGAGLARRAARPP